MAIDTHILPPIEAAIPAELRDLPQWVLWRGIWATTKDGAQKITKVPYSIRLRKASTTDPQTWSSFERITRALPVALDAWKEETPESPGGGIGFVFTATDPFVGIDLDHAVIDGVVESWAQEIVALINTYTEYSISGTGIHCICRGTWPAGRNRKGAIEIYCQERFFTMSGHAYSVGDFAELPDRTQELAQLHEQLFPKKVPKPPSTPRTSIPMPLSDVEILQKARVAKNGAKFSVLYAGDTSGYTSASEADIALCSMLAFWTQSHEQIDGLFRQSGLYREKWDTKRGAEKTYGSQTIQNALDNLGNRFEPHRQSSPTNAAIARSPVPLLYSPPEYDDEPPPWLENGHSMPESIDIPYASPSHPPISSALRLNKSGNPYADPGNFDVVLRCYPPWKGSLWWDDFRQTAIYGKEIIDDLWITRLAIWCGQNLGMSIQNEGQLRRCVHALAHEHARDTLLEYLQSLSWDGTSRLNTWLTTYAGADDTPENAWAGQALLCAMASRGLYPGCIQRLVVIFEGAENIGKSRLVQALGGEAWTRVLDRGVDTKDAVLLLRGCWVMEIAEMDSFSRSEDSRVKAFISTTEDSIILKYDNDTSQFKRRTVLIATVNPSRPYFKGQTGNTRFLPVRVGNIDLEGFQSVREQLIAEAVTRVQSGAKWWIEPEDGILDELRELRREEDIYEPLVEAYLTENAGMSDISMQDILRFALQITEPERWKDRALVIRIGVIIKKLGYEKRRIRKGKSLSWAYYLKK
jgi:hypothetical protein